MKLKMARNSLFAVLLRSPWWVSIAVVVVFALAANALLPQQYVVFGVMGGLPFLVIGVIAAYRQFQAPAREEVERTLDALATMPWRDFSGLLEQAYTRQGYAVSRAPGDAADLRITKDGRTTLVAARRWKASNHGVEPLRALARARVEQDASHCTYVSLVDPGNKTRRFAADNRVDILDGPALVSLVRKLPLPKG